MFAEDLPVSGDGIVSSATEAFSRMIGSASFLKPQLNGYLHRVLSTTKQTTTPSPLQQLFSAAKSFLRKQDQRMRAILSAG